MITRKIPINKDSRYKNLAVPGVRDLQAYVPGKSIDYIDKQGNRKKFIKLASNENPLGASPLALQAAINALAGMARYPDDAAVQLKEKLASLLCIDRNQIVVGNGSCNVLELVVRAFVAPHNEVIVSANAFTMYAILTQSVGAVLKKTQEKSWQQDINRMLTTVTSNTRIIFIANPNNPTGTWVTLPQLEKLISHCPEHVLIVIDEAYFEYASHKEMAIENYASVVNLIDQYPNLIVTRTFSKAYGLAGLRIGYGVCNAQLADILNRVRQPFNVNGVAMEAAIAALDDMEFLTKSLHLNTTELNRLKHKLSTMGLETINSAANFLCVNFRLNAEDIYQKLLLKGIIVRPVIIDEIKTYLRISIGREEENDALVRALQDII